MSHPLLARLRHSDPEERLRACEALVADPSAVLLLDGLAGALGDPVRGVWQAASDAFAALARQHDVAPALREALRADSAHGRAVAALSLARVEPPSLRLLPALVDGLGLPDGKLRWRCTRLLVETGRLHGEVLPLLLGLSRTSESAVVRRMARHGLRELARDDPDAARTLIEATRDPDVPARRAGYAALASLLEPSPAVFARLAEALRSEPDGASRRIATVALGALGQAAPDSLGPAALDALHEASRDPDDPDLRRGATRALALIGAP